MEHTHRDLRFSFFKAYGLFAIGIISAYIANSGFDAQSKLVIYGFSIFMILVATVILNSTFKEKRKCPVCKMNTKK